MLKFKKMTSLQIKRLLFNGFCLLIGSMLLAFGTAVFLTQLKIVSGGLSGIGIIVDSLIKQINPSNETQYIDIVVLILTWVLWVIGLLVIGKEFAIKTLFSSLVYPLFLTLFLRVNVFIEMAKTVSGDGAIGNILLCAIFGGVFVGGGVALTFVGGGSSGGVDVLYFIIEKYLHIKQSISSFVLDAIIIVSSMFLIKDNIVNSLCGIISSFLCALMIEYIYIGSQTSYQVDIISDKWEEISAFAQDKLARGATIIPVKGGYKQEDRIILRVVFDKSQLNKIKDFIANTDPKAFVTFTQTNAVYGEGFKQYKDFEEKNKKPRKKGIKNKKNDGK